VGKWRVGLGKSWEQFDEVGLEWKKVGVEKHGVEKFQVRDVV
jgi:hypothetical protein